jgi:hypothetical protein
MKSDIIEYRYGANTRRNEYGSEYLLVYKKPLKLSFLDQRRDIVNLYHQHLQHLYRQFYIRSHNRM